MHKFTDDFYGKQLKVILLGELRPMTTFANASTTKLCEMSLIVKVL